MAQGFKAGAVVEVEQVDPTDDQLVARVKGYHRSLRKDDAGKVMVEVL